MITINKLHKLAEKLELRNREEEIVIVIKTSQNKYLKKGKRSNRQTLIHAVTRSYN